MYVSVYVFIYNYYNLFSTYNIHRRCLGIFLFLSNVNCSLANKFHMVRFIVGRFLYAHQSTYSSIVIYCAYLLDHSYYRSFATRGHIIFDLNHICQVYVKCFKLRFFKIKSKYHRCEAYEFRYIGISHTHMLPAILSLL